MNQISKPHMAARSEFTHLILILSLNIYQSAMPADNTVHLTVIVLQPGLQNSAEDSTLKWYKELQESAAQCAQSFEQLNSPKDTQVSLCLFAWRLF